MPWDVGRAVRVYYALQHTWSCWQAALRGTSERRFEEFKMAAESTLHLSRGRALSQSSQRQGHCTVVR